MAIMCRKCNYIMNKSEILGYVMSDLYDFMKDSVLPSLFTRGFAQDVALNFSNKQTIPCPVCFQYEGWVKTS